MLTLHTYIYQYRRLNSYLHPNTPFKIWIFTKKKFTKLFNSRFSSGLTFPRNSNPASSGLECLYNQWVIEGFFLPPLILFLFLSFVVSYTLIHTLMKGLYNTLLHPFIHIYLYVPAEATTSSIIHFATAISFSAFGCSLDDCRVVLMAHLFPIVAST